MQSLPKVLLVDDMAENITAMEILFSEMEVDLVCVNSGNEALKKTLENDFALALVDVQMPDMDGFETVRLMRQDEKTEHLPVIFISAIYSDDYYKIKGIETGAIDFITKPVDPKILTGKIRVHLDLYRHKSSLKEARDRLELLVSERTEELRISNEELRNEIAERKKLEKAILETEERERERLGSELHDDLGQLLTGIAFKSNFLESILREKSIPEVEDAARITFLVDRAKKQLKFLTRGLMPIGEGHENLISSLSDLASGTRETFNLSCDFTFDPSFYIKNKTAATSLYRIAQEAVSNAVKHANPEYIKINLSREDDKIRLIISDNGTGIDENILSKGGMGLKTMNYRADIIDASFNISSDTDGGTIVTCTFPDELSGGD